MKLTFHREVLDGIPGSPGIHPCTLDGEPIDDVVACSVECGTEEITKMTLTVYVFDSVSDKAARRLLHT